MDGQYSVDKPRIAIRTMPEGDYRLNLIMRGLGKTNRFFEDRVCVAATPDKDLPRVRDFNPSSAIEDLETQFRL